MAIKEKMARKRALRKKSEKPSAEGPEAALTQCLAVHKLEYMNVGETEVVLRDHYQDGEQRVI